MSNTGMVNTVQQDQSITFATFFQRSIIGFLDWLIMFPVFMFVGNWIQIFGYQNRTIIPLVFFQLLFYIYIIFLTTKFGLTPSHLLLKYRIINRSGNHISIKNCLIRYSYYFIHSIFTYILAFVAIQKLPSDLVITNYKQIAEQIALNAGSFKTLTSISSILALVNYFAILVSKKKQTVTDMLSGTYVVKKIEKEQILKNKKEIN